MNLEQTHRTFESGSTRDTASGKMQVSKYSHPLNDYSYNTYMLSKQTIGGKFREGSNWQKGIPREALMESLCRHIEELKLLTHGYNICEARNGNTVTTLVNAGDIEGADSVVDKTIEETLNAIRFNSEALKLSYLEEQYGKGKHL